MPKGVSKDLFYLIQSLSKSEKWYFKVNTKTADDKTIYIQLFDEVEGQKEYDEVLILKKLPAIKKSHLPKLKNYLYELIVQKLNSYYSDKTINFKMRSLIQSGHVLYEKSLYEQSLKVFEKAKKLGYIHDLFPGILDVIVWELRIVHFLFRMGKNRNAREKMTEIWKEEKEVLQKLENLHAYKNIVNSIQYFNYVKGTIRDESEKKELLDVMNVDIAKDETKAQSYSAKILYFNINSLFNLAIGDLNKSIEFRKKALEHIESFPEIIKGNIASYINSIHNLLVVDWSYKNGEYIVKLIEKMRNLPNQYPTETKEKVHHVKIFRTTYGVEIAMYNKWGHFDKSVDLIVDIEDGLVKHGNLINKIFIVGFYFLISIAYFGKEDYKSALRSINRLLNHKTFKVSRGMHTAARLLNIIIHFELGNIELMSTLIQSANRFLKKTPKQNQVVQVTIKFLNKNVVNQVSKSELQFAYGELERTLSKLYENPIERKFFDYFDFHAWVKCKIDNQPLSAVLKRKNTSS